MERGSTARSIPPVAAPALPGAAETRCRNVPKRQMEKREIRLADGRHLIFYTFESPRCDAPPALPASSGSEPEPRAPESQRGDHE